MKTGHFLVVNANPKKEDLAWKRRPKRYKLAKKTEWISDIKFSPDDKKCAIGSHDNKIYIYKTKNFKKPCLRPLNKHSSYIIHFDWTSDGSYI